MKKLIKNKPVILLVAAAVLLLASTVRSTHAALTYYSENYMAEVTVSNIGVKLLENEKEVSRRNYLENDRWDEVTGTLMKEMLDEDESLVLGKTYEEVLVVENSGEIDTYVRVILTKSWQDANDVKNPDLSPDLIGLNILTGENGWFVDEDASTAERTVLYYKNVLPVDGKTPAFTDSVRIDPAIGTKVIKNEEVTTGTAGEPLKTVTYVHEYDGYTFCIEAEVDAVQTHNAADAIKSAWGVDVSVAEDGSLALQ